MNILLLYQNLSLVLNTTTSQSETVLENSGLVTELLTEYISCNAERLAMYIPQY